MSTRWMKLPVIGLFAFTAACGGGETRDAEQTAVENQSIESGVAAPEAAGAPAEAAQAGQIHTVRMVTTQNGASGVFEPAELTAKRGDVVRFVTDGKAPHNVNFQVKDNAGKAGLPGPTPYLTTEGQTYDFTVEMDPGAYAYQCDPHAMTGMVGRLTVQE